MHSSNGRNPIDGILLADVGLIGIVNREMGRYEIGNLIRSAQRRRDTESVALVFTERHPTVSTFIDEPQPEPLVRVSAVIEQLSKVLAIARHPRTAAATNLEAQYRLVLIDDEHIAQEIDEPQGEPRWQRRYPIVEQRAPIGA